MGRSLDEKIHIDRENKVVVEQRGLLNKLFLISTEMDPPKWKMTGDRMKIQGYLCMKATTTVRDSVDIIAWFSPQIPVAVGPAQYNSLPGAILELSAEEGRMTISAIDVALGSTDAALIKKPEKGDIVTEEEFHKIRKEKTKEMRNNRGGGRRFGRSG